jgi:hypothetical protein
VREGSKENPQERMSEKKMPHTVYVDVLSDACPEELPTDIKLAA